MALGCGILAATLPEDADFHGYGHRAVGMSCKVLIVGDSTALIGLNPSVIERKTGLETCNISEPRPVLDFVGPSGVVDDYLAHNRRPLYIVASWSLTDFRLDRGPSFSHNADGFDYAIRYDRSAWLWRQMLIHPFDAMDLLAWEESLMFSKIRLKVTGSGMYAAYQVERSLRDKHKGWEPRGGAPATRCVGLYPNDMPSPREVNRIGVESFRKRYEAKGIEVLIDVSPAADCIPQLQSYLALIHGLHDNQFEALPISNFDDRGVHLVADSADRYSEEVAEQILALMKKDGEATR